MAPPTQFYTKRDIHMSWLENDVLKEFNRNIFKDQSRVIIMLNYARLCKDVMDE
jgi:hypothetical protein